MQLWNSRRIRKEKQELKRKAVLGIMLTLLFIGILSLTFEIQPVEASGTFYISSDYTFTSNIYEPIVVTADNIIIDGAGYTVQGTGSGTGIDLSDRNNVTLKNVEVTNFTSGIYLGYSSNNTLTGNTVSSNNNPGIHLLYSNNNTLAGNTASSNNWDGIVLSASSNNVLTGNTASSNNHTGIYLDLSSNNTITGNTVSSNNDYSIYLFNSSDNAIYHNDFIDNTNQAFVTAGYTNIWDDGAGKGNYWSDYEDKYPDAEIINGIWDTPYVIYENNQDNYPIVPEFPTLTSMLLMLIVLSVAIAIYKRRLLKTPIH